MRLTLRDPETDYGGDGTRRFYAQNAATYAHSTFRLPASPLLDRFLREMPAGAPVLDLGCGAGRDLLAMRRAGVEPIGVDSSPEMARLALGNADASTLCADARHLPFAAAAFLGIWASASLLHVPRADLPTALSEIARVLSPVGWTYVSMKVGEGESVSADGRWFTYVAPDELSALLEAAGLEIRERRSDRAAASRQASWISYLAQRAAGR